MKNQILAVIVLGFSGSGKGTVGRSLVESNLFFKTSVSDATKPVKPGDLYNHISREEFLLRKEEGYYIETDEYAGNLYGSPVNQFLENVKAGVITVFDVEANGAEKIIQWITSRFGESRYLAFRLEVAKDELERRVTNRNRDDNSERLQRKRADMARTEKMLRISQPIEYTNKTPESAAKEIYEKVMERNFLHTKIPA